jgi:diguanylate cyclase (GGDEF)-like protein/PAS domain S-box-containing protein
LLLLRWLAVDELSMSRRAWWLYLVVLLAAVPVYFFAVGGVAQRVLFYVYGFSSVLAIVVGLRMHRSQRRWPWLAFAGGLLLFAVGDVAFDVYAAAGGTIPVPSSADYLYLAAYPILAWGMALLVRYRVRGADWTSALDGVMVAIGVGVIAWVFVMAPYAHDRTLSLGAQIVPIAYPALDLLLVAVLVHLLLSRGVRNTSFRLLAVSVIALLVADGAFAVATVHNTYRDGSVVDLGWLLSYALWGAAALHPSMSRLTDPSPPTERRRSRAGVAVLALAALASPVLIIIQSVRGLSTDEVLLASSSVVMFVLVLARVSRLTRALDVCNRELGHAATRQLVLTDAAVAFVGAGDMESVNQAAVHAAVALAADAGSWSTFTASRLSVPTVVAVAGPSPYAVGEPADAELAARWAQWNPSDGASLLTAQVHPVGPEPLRFTRYVGPVVVDDQLRGQLVVGHAGDGSEALLPALELVCAQMGLALKTVEATEERMLARNQRQFRSLVQNSSDVVTVIGANGRVSYQSPGVLAVLGRDADSLTGEVLMASVHPDDLPAVQAQLTKILAGGLGGTTTVEGRFRHIDGSWREIDSVMTNLLDDPDVAGIVLNSRDVTDRRALERELNLQAFSDSLTGLANRALFLDRVAHALDRADRQAGPVAVLFLDVDDFKMVNDSLGHPAGDQLLIAVAERVKAATRPGDTVARLGGDEFGVLLESGRMPETAHFVAGRIAEVLKAPIRIGTEDISARVSIGIALGQPPTDGPDGLLRDADLAMYMAKRNGKGRFEMFRPAMHEEAIRRLEVAADLRRAIEGGQLEVFYQPIVTAHTAKAVGAEALVRWHHPTRGLVAPIDFIPIAESTGLIVPLGKWVLTEACRQAQSWRNSGLVNGAFYMSVNLSARQLQDPALLDDVAAAIRNSGLPANALLLEVTESTLMEDLAKAAVRLQALKDLGLRLAIDDFGTGYSSLSHLRNLPVDVVKIDKSFVDRITQDAEGAAIVRSVIDLSAALGLTSIAEGVERDDQLAVLDDLGCDNVQGYLFAKPMPSDEFADSLTQPRPDSLQTRPGHSKPARHPLKPKRRASGRWISETSAHAGAPTA